MDNEGLHVDHSVGYANNASHFRRAAFKGVGGYPSESLGADAALDAAFSGLAHAVEPLRGDKEPTRGERFYVYRWAVSPVHKSGSGVEDFYREVGELLVVEARFYQSPHRQKDYVANWPIVSDQGCGRNLLSIYPWFDPIGRSNPVIAL